jgi:hypothetical protein
MIGIIFEGAISCSNQDTDNERYIPKLIGKQNELAWRNVSK